MDRMEHGRRVKSRLVRCVKVTLLVSTVVWTGCQSLEDRWQSARQKDTIPAYQEFLENCPAEKVYYTRQAHERLATLFFEKAEREQSAKWYAQFLIHDEKAGRLRGPDEPDLRKMAQEEIARLTYVEADRTGTIEAYCEFEKKFPQSPYAREANQKIQDLLVQDAERLLAGARETNTREAYEALILEAEKKYPGMTGVRAWPILRLKRKARYLAESLRFSTADGRRLSDTAAWEHARRRGAIQGYVSYYCFYPKGRHRDDALDALRELAPPDLSAMIAKLTSGDSAEAANAARNLKIDSQAYDILVPFLCANLFDSTPLAWEGMPGLKATTAGAVAAETLGKIGDPRAVDVLIQAAGSGEYGRELRESAIGSLGDMPDPRALEAITRALDDREERIRRAAAEAIVGFPAADLLKIPDVLRNMTRSRDWMAREKAMKILGKIADARFLDDLVGGLKDRQREVRIAAAKALGALGDQRAVPHLVQAMKEQEYMLTRALRRSLQILTGQAFPELDDHPERSHETWSRWLEKQSVPGG